MPDPERNHKRENNEKLDYQNVKLLLGKIYTMQSITCTSYALGLTAAFLLRWKIKS